MTDRPEMGGPPCILIVDDDEGVREFLRILVSDSGYAVAVADGGREALEMLETLDPSLIVLDLMMAHMDGFSFVWELERRGRRGTTPIVVLTAAGPARPMVARMGADAYLEKPFRIDAFMAIVERLVGPAPS